MQDNPDTTLGKSSWNRQNGPESAAGGSFAPGGTGSGGASGSSSPRGGSTTDTLNQAKEKLSDAASEAGDKVVSRLDMQKDRAAESLGSVAQAIRQASDQLRAQDEGAAMHEYVASAANQVERLSGYLRSTNTRDMVNGVERFAREQPALFVGGALMLGLLGARFLKSSGESRSYRSEHDERLLPTTTVNPARSFGEQGIAGGARTGSREFSRRPASTFTRRGGEDS
jgi:hypothetical protein